MNDDYTSMLVEQNVRLVKSEIYRMTGSSPDDDMIQEGILGLLRAALGFDRNRGTKFSTYAVPWIKRNIHRELGKRAKHDRHNVSIDASFDGTEDGATMHDTICDDKIPPPSLGAGCRVDAAAVRDAVGKLSIRERQAIELRFGFDRMYGRTFAEVGADMGVSTQRAKAIVDRAIARLHESLCDWAA